MNLTREALEVIDHLMEVERRKLYLSRACSTSWIYLRQLGRTSPARRDAQWKWAD